MSHHFDTPSGRDDPRINLCDFYLFEGGPETTVMVMTVNPSATTETAMPFRDEGVYAFRFDADGDRREEVSFKLRFGEVTHREGDGHHVQELTVVRSVGDAAGPGVDGEVIAHGQTEAIVTEGPVRAFAGVVQDPFAGDAHALNSFRAAFAEGEYRPQEFTNHTNFFAGRTVAGIALEVPTEMIGAGRVDAWATISLHGHAPEMQVARWGLPLLTHAFIDDESVRERYNRAQPADDDTAVLDEVRRTVSAYVTQAGTAPDPQAYAERVVALFGALGLPYTLGTPASFDFTGFNGRGLRDNVMDNAMSLLTNSPLGTGIRPESRFVAPSFPYLVQPGSDRA